MHRVAQRQMCHPKLGAAEAATETGTVLFGHSRDSVPAVPLHLPRCWSWQSTAAASDETRSSPSSEDDSFRRQSLLSPTSVSFDSFKSDTCIIFDWDDTLLCTSYLNLHNDEALPPEATCYLRGIEAAAVKLLETSQRVGHTFIVTNSESGWVEYSAAQWLPAVVPLLRSHNMRIISARASYEEKFPGDLFRWKTQSFLDIERELDPQAVSNVISLGDSHNEMDAAHVLGGALDASAGRCDSSEGIVAVAGSNSSTGVRVKTVKFQERPSPEELCKQLELVLQKFAKIVESPKQLKIALERKWAKKAQ
mmetsp:Transcript_54075/g.125737  ORF Transcript_54075/g.125737 Transcript_54075/m.125737 type:complete len:308 (+) Transcript_54075:24-947(+)|eukprot:CAMPEP_0171093232 /NCGR_PEP_ID=MMETSP0766_2-20121228/38960_1 /TAXON_ID=439317 /ORGANISM="Gambierdiscus australes, Strain CAWD 149" /LENGTH=307 /DNA_ID=CAMNT_0011551647 /DNA_START=24 /DNA_END=947 /DNA_ORIENTATION=-